VSQEIPAKHAGGEEPPRGEGTAGGAEGEAAGRKQPGGEQLGGEQPGRERISREQISLEEFGRLDLRIARVLEAERHPKADRLLKLRIDLGTEQRQLVAGIAAQYRPEDLVGRSIVVVANLKPARLRGELSEGMLLAASSGEVISLLVPDREVPPGSGVR
jgi:methionyl-tRNA synthetase